MQGGFRSHDTLTESILGFAEYLRSRDFNIGIREVHEALTAASLGVIADKRSFAFSLKTIFCSSAEDALRFDLYFEQYWETLAEQLKGALDIKSRLAPQKKEVRSAVFMGKGHANEKEKEQEDTKNVTGANAVEKLRQTDFSMVSSIDSSHLEKLAMDLWKQMGKRLKRKLRLSVTKGTLDIRQTIRSSISSGGSMLDLRYKDKKPEKYRLVILLDVSGSMDKYSFYLLRFIMALREHFRNIEAFIFSTQLVRITDFLRIKNLDGVLSYLSQGTQTWSSGTKIGESMKAFNAAYSKRVLNGKTLTLILSDGLDTGEPELLAAEMGRIKRRTRRLIWLNPLKGSEGYQPLARGMAAALPAIDVFSSAHSLESILELERYLADV